MRLLVCDEGDLTEDERAACQALWDRVWPPDPGGASKHTVRPTTFLRALLWDAVEAAGAPSLVGACALEDRTIVVAGEPHRIAGLGGVAVEATCRGRDYGTRVVGAALAEARQRGFAYGVLFCLPDREPFYARMGWRRLEGELVVTVRGEDRRADQGRLVLALPLSAAAEAAWPCWRRAPIHLGQGSW